MGGRWYLGVLAALVPALDNGLARTPPMGFLSWARFTCTVDCDKFPEDCISERLYKEMADALVAGGFLAAGYDHVNVDDCWAAMDRDSDGRIRADPARFPSGLAALGDYLHARGLKFGLYTDIGTKTCGGYPGLSGHFEEDARTFASWKIDMLKVDGCNPDADFAKSYPAFGRVLNATGRPILYSCSWPAYLPDHGDNGTLRDIARHCNIWRNYDDIADSWESVADIVRFWSRNRTDLMVQVAGPGHFNDPDMLLIGNPGLSASEQRAQMSLWAIFAAPLLISVDLRRMPPESRDILLNPEVIAVNQDRLGLQGWRADDGVFVRPTATGWAVVLANFARLGPARDITVNFRKHIASAIDVMQVRDLWARKDLGRFTDNVTLRVDLSTVRMLHMIVPSVERVEHVGQPAAEPEKRLGAWQRGVFLA
jgi:hypothetical protein